MKPTNTQLAEAQAVIVAMLEERKDKKRKPLYPAPRYDDLYFSEMEKLDKDGLIDNDNITVERNKIYCGQSEELLAQGNYTAIWLQCFRMVV